MTSKRRGIRIIFSCLVLRPCPPPIFASDHWRRGRPGNEVISVNVQRLEKAWAKGKCVFGGNSQSMAGLCAIGRW